MHIVEYIWNLKHDAIINKSHWNWVLNVIEPPIHPFCCCWSKHDISEIKEKFRPRRLVDSIDIHIFFCESNFVRVCGCIIIFSPFIWDCYKIFDLCSLIISPTVATFPSWSTNTVRSLGWNIWEKLDGGAGETPHGRTNVFSNSGRKKIH